MIDSLLIDEYLVSPNTSNSLRLSANGLEVISIDEKEKFEVDEDVIVFLENSDAFYEGVYLNRTKFIPKNYFSSLIGLWVINNGYINAVNRNFTNGDVIVELGCASGVDFFAKKYIMIGIDLSITSLKNLNGYKLALQADATKLPISNNSVDGIISSYFWEHISAPIKNQMLVEFKRVLKPGGKLVFLYDVETENSFVDLLKKENPKKYKELFLDKDGHFGYETPAENRKRFIEYGFEVQKHFGMERTWLQSNSVYEKFSHLTGWKGRIGKIGKILGRYRSLNLLNIFFVRLIDETVGRLFNEKKSRIIISVLKQKA